VDLRGLHAKRVIQPFLHRRDAGHAGRSKLWTPHTRPVFRARQCGKSSGPLAPPNCLAPLLYRFICATPCMPGTQEATPFVHNNTPRACRHLSWNAALQPLPLHTRSASYTFAIVSIGTIVKSVRGNQWMYHAVELGRCRA
jgi:hypothetical protein